MRRSFKRGCIIIWIVLCVLLFIGIIFTISFVADSVNTLEYNEFGIDYNRITKKAFPDQVYESGRHVLGVGHRFIIFPSTAVILDYSNSTDGDDSYGPIDVKTSDGFPMTLSLSLQYQFSKKNVSAAFQAIGTEYKPIFSFLFRTAIFDAASQFAAQDYFTKRKEIGDAILEAARQDVPWVQVLNVQLSTIQVPDNLETSLTVKRRELEIEQREQNLQELKSYQSDTRVMVAEQHKERDLVYHAADAEAERLRGQGLATAQRVATEAERSAMETLATEFGFNSSQLLTYRKIIRMKEKGIEEPLLVNMGTAAIYPLEPGQVISTGK